MDKALLQQAHDALRIKDVALRRARCEVVDDFDPAHEHPQMTVQLMRNTMRSEILEPADGQSALHRIFRVYVQLGIRWVRFSRGQDARESAKNADGGDGKQPEVLALVEAIFVAEYEMRKEVDQACLDHFALHNAPFNVWPFWREYVVSQAQRMNLPRFVVPLMPLPAPCSDASEEAEEG